MKKYKQNHQEIKNIYISKCKSTKVANSNTNAIRQYAHKTPHSLLKKLKTKGRTKKSIFWENILQDIFLKVGRRLGKKEKKEKTDGAAGLGRITADKTVE